MIFVLDTSVFMSLVFIFNVFFHLMRGGRCHGFMYQINRKRGHQEAGTKLQHEEARITDGSEVSVCGAQEKIDGALKLLSLPDTLHVCCDAVARDARQCDVA